MDDTERADWERRLRDIPPKKTQGSAWQSIDEMNGFGVDKLGNIYWHGQLIQVLNRIELRWYELFLATLVTVAAVAQAIAAIFPIVPKIVSKWAGY